MYVTIGIPSALVTYRYFTRQFTWMVTQSSLAITETCNSKQAVMLVCIVQQNRTFEWYVYTVRIPDAGSDIR